MPCGFGDGSRRCRPCTNFLEPPLRPDLYLWPDRVEGHSMMTATLLFFTTLFWGQSNAPFSEPNTPPPTSSKDHKPQSQEIGGSDAYAKRFGNIEVLSDTGGVNLRPYLQVVVERVRKNWHSLIPESARWRHGKVVIEFAIAKDGKVQGMKLIPTSFISLSSSGDVVLDRAAWGGILASAPFPPLPTEFTGQFLTLRLPFYYNPGKGEIVEDPSKSGIAVSLSPAGGGIQVPVGGSKLVAATVTGTPDKAVEWELTGAGCSGLFCGKVVDGLYNAPTVLPSLPSVTITAISKADPTARATLTVFIVQPH